MRSCRMSPFRARGTEMVTGPLVVYTVRWNSHCWNCRSGGIIARTRGDGSSRPAGGPFQDGLGHVLEQAVGAIVWVQRTVTRPLTRTFQSANRPRSHMTSGNGEFAGHAAVVQAR